MAMEWGDGGQINGMAMEWGWWRSNKWNGDGMGGWRSNKLEVKLEIKVENK